MSLDPAQIDDLYRRYFAILRAKCSRMLGDADEAADVAQETLIRFWQSERTTSAGTTDPAAETRRVLGWLYRTSTRLAIDRLRSAQARNRLGLALPEADCIAIGEDALTARYLCAQLVSSAPPDELEVAMLSRLDRLSQVEIASLLGRSERTVRRQLQRFDVRVTAFRQELHCVNKG
ncbi:MAG TPA: RNA polymerase sigma factor [Pseudomonadota bacterium]|nr:RNA polymerase sigma factor [Pseudomonadota bacterium]